MKLHILILLFTLLFAQTKAQKDCDFSITDDTTICEPGVITLAVSGNNLDKVKWTSDDLISDDTLYKVSVDIQKSTTIYVSNRIPDPVNLIVNGDFEQGNVAFDSDYYSSCLNGQMPQGSYCINDRTGIYWPAWKSCGDHTSGTGKMFITDGAIVPDEKIWCQTVAVDPFTDYEFSAYLTSVLNQANAILQFTINDNPIGDVFQASPNECEWNQFFQVWNSQNVASAKICITNQNTASDGNDFALDDISFNKVCYTEDSIGVTVIPPIEVKINEDTTICPGDDFTIKARDIYPNNFEHSWSTGETTSEISYSDIGEIQLTITSPEGCKGKDTMLISQIANPVLKPLVDTTLCFPIFKEYKLNAGSANWVVWDHPSGTGFEETWIATEPGEYTVTLYNGYNCWVTDRVTLTDFCSTHLFLPNTFTPNNDGINDDFGGEAVATYGYQLKIYNRWGKIVFESTSLNNRWTGENAPTGTYTYLINYTIASPEGGYLENLQQIGNVNLIR